LQTWVKAARKRLNTPGRGEIGDSKIGEILSASKREPDQPWPPEPVREIIEMVRGRALESGFGVWLRNRRLQPAWRHGSHAARWRRPRA